MITTSKRAMGSMKHRELFENLTSDALAEIRASGWFACVAVLILL
jgi:hypothetical protein